MSDWAARVAPLIERARESPWDDSWKREADAIIRERLDALWPDGWEDRVWGSMTYACADDDGCQTFSHRVELGVGVEGPPEFREDSTYVACAFVAGRCPACGKPLTHVNWKADETYPEPRERQRTAWMFRLSAKHPGESELVEPMYPAPPNPQHRAAAA